MRLFVQQSITGELLTVAALGLSAVAAEAMGGNANGPDAYIGIIGGSPQKYNYSASGNVTAPTTGVTRPTRVTAATPMA